MLRLMKTPEHDTLPDLWGPMDPIGVPTSDSPRERAAGSAESSPSYRGSAMVTVSLSGVSCDDPPTNIWYFPGTDSQLSLSTLKIERYLGSIVRLTALDSPGARATFCHPTSRLNGSPALKGKVA